MLAKKNETQPDAIKAYKKALNILKEHPTETNFTKDNQFVTGANIESIHRELIQLLSKNNTESEFRKQVEKSFTEHLYAELQSYLNAQNWQEADDLTYRLILTLAKREKEKSLEYDSMNSLSCPDLQRIDKLWVSNSHSRFGFSVEKEILIKTGNRLGIKPEQLNDKDYKKYLQFAKAVGWYEGGAVNDYVSNWELIKGIKGNLSKYRGSIPYKGGRFKTPGAAWKRKITFFSRVATCKL